MCSCAYLYIVQDPYDELFYSVRKYEAVNFIKKSTDPDKDRFVVWRIDLGTKNLRHTKVFPD